MTTAALLFDLDGTLLDTAPEFFAVINQLLANHDKPPMSYSALRQTVSAGSPGMLHASFGVSSLDPVFTTLKSQFLDLYSTKLASLTTWFPGINQTLATWEASQRPWGIVTNKPTWLAEPLIQQLALADRCHTLVCGDTLAVSKPDPAPLLLAAERLDVSPSHCLYVGDHPNDIIAAKAAGMRSVAVGYGYLTPQDAPQTWKADYLVNTPKALTRLVNDALSHGR